MPLDFNVELIQEGFEVAHDTVTDGNCGIDAFASGLLDVGRRDKILSSTHQFKQIRKLRNDLKELIAHCRRSAGKWMQANAETTVWDDITFKSIAVAMAGRAGRTFGDQLKAATKDKEWIDCSVLLALACIFSDDVIIHQQGQEPSALGPSLMEKLHLLRCTLR